MENSDEQQVEEKLHTFRTRANCMVCERLYTSAFTRLPLPPPGCSDKTNDEWIELINKTHMDRVLHVCPDCIYKVSMAVEFERL